MVNKTFLPPPSIPEKSAKHLKENDFPNWHGFR